MLAETLRELLAGIRRGVLNAYFGVAFVLGVFVATFLVFVLGTPMNEKFWEAMTAVATWASVFVLLIAAGAAVSQLIQLRASYQVTAFMQAAESVDSVAYEQALTRLRTLEPQLHDGETALEYFWWASDERIKEFKDSALLIGNALERIGAMIKYRALDRDLIMDYMALTIVKSYDALEYARRNTLPGEGWTYIDGLAEDAKQFLAAAEPAQAPFFIDGKPATAQDGGLVLSVKADRESASVLSGDGGRPVYELALYVKNATTRRIQRSATISVSAAPEAGVTLVQRSRPVTAYLDSLPARQPAPSSCAYATTLLIEPGKYQPVISVIASSPDDKPVRCTWTISTTAPRTASYAGTLEIPLTRRRARMAG